MGKIKSLVGSAWKLAVSFLVLNLIFDLLENFAGFGLARNFVMAPYSTVKRLTGN